MNLDIERPMFEFHAYCFRKAPNIDALKLRVPSRESTEGRKEPRLTAAFF